MEKDLIWLIFQRRPLCNKYEGTTQSSFHPLCFLAQDLAQALLSFNLFGLQWVFIESLDEKMRL